MLLLRKIEKKVTTIQISGWISKVMQQKWRVLIYLHSPTQPQSDISHTTSTHQTPTTHTEANNAHTITFPCNKFGDDRYRHTNDNKKNSTERTRKVCGGSPGQISIALRENKNQTERITQLVNYLYSYHLSERETSSFTSTARPPVIIQSSTT